MKLNTDVASLQAQKNLSASSAALEKTLAVLASGKRITSAADDAAGLGVATQLDAQAASFSMAMRNANDGISIVQSADAGYATLSDSVARMRELAMQSANGSLSAQDRAAIGAELTQLKGQVDQVTSTASYNGTPLLATGGASVSLQVGAGGTSSDAIDVKLPDTTLQSLGLSGVNLDTAAGARSSLDAIDGALQRLSSARADLGASQNRLLSAVDTAQSSFVTRTEASGRITDADMAAASSSLAAGQILAQAGVAVLAQAHRRPALALKLLG